MVVGRVGSPLRAEHLRAEIDGGPKAPPLDGPCSQTNTRAYGSPNQSQTTRGFGILVACLENAPAANPALQATRTRLAGISHRG